MVGQPTQIPWPLTTSPGQTPMESAGRLVNCYAEPLDNDRGIVYHRSPGSSAFGKQTGTGGWTFWGLTPVWMSPPDTAVLPSGLFRGGIFVNNILYAVIGDKIYGIVNGGGFTTIGIVPGSDKVFFARNNRAPVPDICLVCSAGAFRVFSTLIENYPDINVGSPTCVIGFEGFFIFGYGNGDMLSSDINNTDINLLNLARTETNPDGVTQIISWSGQLYVFGHTTCEIWGFPVNPTGFPFTRLGYNFVPGLIFDHCVAGSEPEFGQPPIYVGSDHTVRQIQGYAPIKISSPDLDRLIKAVADNSTLEAMCYVADGVPFWELSSPDWTWVYNCQTQTWSERQSYLQVRSRLTGSVFSFEDHWLCGDILQSGYMLEPDAEVYKEIDDPFLPVIYSLPVENFPINIACPRADFLLQFGAGMTLGHDPDETDPMMEISWSDDGGQTWKNPRQVKIGRQAQTQTRTSIYRTGMTGIMGRIWKLSLPPAVHFGMIKGTMTAIGTEY